MPIYDFLCTECGCKQELMRRISAPSQETCPQCGKETLTKQVSAPSFQLSGSGWYATDFKEKKPNTSNVKETEAPAPSCNPGCACH